MKVNFLKAIRDPRQIVKAKGYALHRGRASPVVEGNVLSQDGELIAKAFSTVAILRSGESSSKGD